MKAADYQKAVEGMTTQQKVFYDILLKMLVILEKAAGDVEP